VGWNGKQRDSPRSFVLPPTMNVTWFLFPLAAGVSLVWNASRFESTELILRRSGKMFLQIIVIMAVILGVLAALSYNL
jgi:hypothetical protein